MSSLSLKKKNHAYLLRVSITHNKKRIHSLYLLINCISANDDDELCLWYGVFKAKLLNNPIASYFLINLDFLLSLITHFDKSISHSFFVFATLEFLISVFLLHFKQYDNIASYIV